MGALAALTAAAAMPEEKPAAKIDLDPVIVTGIRPLLKVAEHPMVEPRFAAAVVAEGDYLYIIGGSNQDGTRLDSVERVDLRTGRAEPWARLQVARRHHRAVIVADKIYVLGGTHGPVDARDPLSAELSDYPGDDPPIEEGLPASLLAPAENLLLPRSLPASRIDGTSSRGSSPARAGFNYVSAVEIIDLATGRVSDGPAMPVPKALFGCVVLDGRILVIGGQQLRGGSIVCTSTTERFDPATNTWSAGVNLPIPRRGTASVVDGFVIFLGGYGGKQAGRTIEVFNPREGFWRRLPDLSEEVNPSSTVWAGRYLFLFGDQGRRSRQLVYDLQAKQLVPYPLALPDSDFATAVLHRDRIYVVGGASLRLHKTTDAIQVFAPAIEIAATNPPHK
jgi:Kelch motif